MSEDWATKAALHVSRELVLDISDEGIVEAASIIRAYQLEHEREEMRKATAGFSPATLAYFEQLRIQPK